MKSKDPWEILPVQITCRQIYTNPNAVVKAVFSVCVGGIFVINNVKLVINEGRTHIAYPQFMDQPTRRQDLMRRFAQNGMYAVCFPCDNRFRRRLQDCILKTYEEEVFKRNEMGMAA